MFIPQNISYAILYHGSSSLSPCMDLESPRRHTSGYVCESVFQRGLIEVGRPRLNEDPIHWDTRLIKKKLEKRENELSREYQSSILSVF